MSVSRELNKLVKKEKENFFQWLSIMASKREQGEDEFLIALVY
jgi:hypothetical protein